MIGIYGGTFDPFHRGHLTMAFEVCGRLALDHLYVVPVARPPHRETPVVDAETRYRMVLAGIGEHPRISVDDRELKRPGISYTVDTLISFREQLGLRPLCLILGVDAFIGLPSWNRWRKVLELAHIVVLRRPSTELSLSAELEDAVAGRFVDRSSQLMDSPVGRIAHLELSQVPVSSSSVRQRLMEGQALENVDLPEGVSAIIEAEGLYGIARGRGA